MITVLQVCFFASVAFFAISLFNVVRSISKRNDIRKAYESICIGTVVSALIFFLPYYYNFFITTEGEISIVKMLLLAAHHAIRLFVVDVNYEEIHSFASNFGAIGSAYTFFGIVLSIIAPLLTFSFILSFAGDFTVLYYKYFCPNRNFCVFTEFNTNTLGLASDIRSKYPQKNIIFVEVNKEFKDDISHVKYLLKDIHAHLLPNDAEQILEIVNMPRRNTEFFLLSENEDDNSNWLIALSKLSSKKGKRQIYVKLEKENRLVENLPPIENTEVYRVEHIHSLCMHTVENLGTRLFKNATEAKNGEKVISILIAGLGGYGVEMVKILSWFTQAEGYKTEFHIFDKDPLAASKFEHLCPGFFSESNADCHCDIHIHSGLLAEASAFDKEIERLKNVNYAFIALGNDNLNVNTAYELRSIFARMDSYPIIQTILRNSNASNLLSNAKNYRGEAYNIEFVGSYAELYSYDFITDTKNKKAVFENILRWARSTEEAQKSLLNEENYKRGKANVLHTQLLEKLNITKETPDRTFAKSKHRYWVNLMFSEGYMFGTKRNDLAKIRSELVAFEELSEANQNIEW